MPSLFNRRSRSVSTSRPVTPASSSAHVAAAQAFLANRQSQGNLSASAAAAALRSMSPTPVPIDQIQTKRMLNRQASNSSVGTATRGRSRPTLQRRPSSGSMTERTFRSPSPGHPANAQTHNTAQAPPVPPLPETFVTEDVPPIPQRSHRRSMSLENFSTRVASPPPVRKPSTLNTAQRKVSASSIAAVAASRSVALRQGNELERPDSRNSYNFSYPRGSRPNSPPPQVTRMDNSVAASQKPSANGISATEARAIEKSLNQTAARPVKKKKKAVAENGEGSHLHNGSMAESASTSKLSSQSSSLDASSTQMPQKAAKTKPKAAVLSGENSHFPDDGHVQQAAPKQKELDQTQQRRAQRAAGALAKRPSVVNEDWEGEQDDVRSSVEVPSSPVTPDASGTVSSKPARKIQSKKPMTEANMSRKIEDSARVHATVTTPPSTQSKKGLTPNQSNTPNGRQPSISPSRSFRFSDRIASDLTAGRKHEPLPRSISPAKSALKHHSPSRSETSPTDGSFPQRRGSSVAPSESSEVSVDVATRKKANRVSFEATPDVVATAEANASVTKESGKRSWFSKSKKPSPLSKAAVDDDNDDEDEGMKPRPVLPSFGSVRKGRSNDTSPSPASRRSNPAATSAGSLSETSSTGEVLSGLSTSGDHAIGSVLAEQNQKSQEHPLPPKVTSVDGTGHVSDSDDLSSDAEEDQSRDPVERTDARTAAVTNNLNPTQKESVAVPAIAIQPATPGLDTADGKEEWVDSVTDFKTSSNSSDTTGGQGDTPGVGLGLAGDDSADEAASPDTSPEHHLNTIDEESDDDSHYDDAPEESSEIEGVGYGSINAIVHSPAIDSSPPSNVADLQDSPLTPSDVNSDPAQDVSWEKSQAYWSGVSKQLRNNVKADQQTGIHSTATRPKAPLEEKSVPPKAVLQPAAEIVANPKPKKSVAATSTMRPTSSNNIRQPEPTDRLSSSVPTLPNRNASRVSPQTGFRHSMREEPSISPTPRPRPQSMIASPTQSMTQPRTSTKKSQSTIAKAGPPRLQRTFSNDSDSDSSFKRSRAKKPAGSGFARRTMRGAPTAGDDASRRSEREVRSMSPVNRQPLSPSAPSKMRTSMRGSQGAKGPTLRNQPEEKRSSSLFSKTRKAKSPSRPMSTLGISSRSKSRFADSDDEGEPASKSYRSRYADSSDEDEPEALRPVRGIPKRKDEGDSTDLEDSSDDQRRRTKPSTPKKKLEVKIPALSSPVASEPMSPTTAKKKGFWGRLRGGKKDKEPNAQFTITERNKKSSLTNGHTPTKTTEASTEASDADAKNAAQLGFGSAAERDAMVEQMMRKLEMAQEPGSASQESSHKRMTPQRVLSDSWPLSPKLSGIPEDRPVTSAGAGEPARPPMGERQPTSETVRTAGGTAVYGRNGKPKKFPRLRRVFGLTD